MLKFENVDFSYGEKNVLSDFNFEAEEKTSTAILGPSGFGKTTLMNLACGLIKPKNGIITPFAAEKPSFVFQENRLLSWYTALGNLTAVNIEKSRAQTYLEKVGLEHEGDKFPTELSGGMQRRLSIARALAFGGDAFYFDEPLQGLDLKTSEEILDLLKTETAGKTLLLITHSPKEAFTLCDRIVLVGESPLEIKADVKKSDFEHEEALAEFIKSRI